MEKELERLQHDNRRLKERNEELDEELMSLKVIQLIFANLMSLSFSYEGFFYILKVAFINTYRLNLKG